MIRKHIAIFILSAFSVLPMEAAITVGTTESFSSGFTRPPDDLHTFTNVTLNNFDATGFDKLVVVFSGENHAGGLDPGTFVTYGGQDMTLAGQIDTGNTGSGQHWAYIAYLDNPTTNGDLVFDFRDGNGVGGAIFGLNGTATGMGNVVLNGSGNSVSITTTGLGSLVVAVGTNNGGTSTAPNPSLPLTQIARIDSGSSAHGSGYQEVATISTITPTFTGGLITMAVEFTAIPEPSAALLGGFGALLLLRRRR